MKSYWIVKHEPLAGFSTSNILRLLVQNRFRIHPKYFLRFLYALLLSTICLPLRLIEYTRFHLKIKRTRIQQAPIFIIGHWRTGTTYLHTLLSLDKTKAFISNKETYCPHFFLAFPRFVKWLISASLPETRPMDNIKIGPELPGEEEHALGAYDRYGFFHSMIFPHNADIYFRYLTFNDCPQKDLNRWKKRYYYFVQKMALLADGRPLVFKNPANTYRLPYLREMFPDAKFIHLYRNPYEVYASALRFHQKTREVFALQSWDEDRLKEDVLRIYSELYSDFDRMKAPIPLDNFIDVRYEDFIANPLQTLATIYKRLNLEGFQESKAAFRGYIQSQHEYQPLIHNIDAEIITGVNTHCAHIIDRYRYPKIQP